MARRRRKDAENKFFCLNCGQESMPILRNRGYQHEDFHRKKLWCYRCKLEINHIECKTLEDIEIFKDNFSKGLYKEEAEQSIIKSKEDSIL